MGGEGVRWCGGGGGNQEYFVEVSSEQCITVQK